MTAPLDRGDAILTLDSVVHGFTDRRGGVSTGALRSLNLGQRPDERPEALAENWRRAVAALSGELAPDRVAVLAQVHGAEVVRVVEPLGPHTPMAEADAAYTTEVGVVLAVRTADCVPVLLAGPSVVGAAHSGWRGTAAGVVPALVAAMIDGSGVDPADLRAVVGPAIGADAYQVGPEVADALHRAGLPRSAFVHPDHPDRVDLRGAVAAQLRGIGVGTVDVIGRCTASDPQLFSHRGDGPDTGRQAALIARCA